MENVRKHIILRKQNIKLVTIEKKKKSVIG